MTGRCRLHPAGGSLAAVALILLGPISAAHFRFQSSGRAVAFAINGSGDETMLDGLPALPGLLR